MEKNSSTCDDCPIRTRSAFHALHQAVSISNQPKLIKGSRARHIVGANEAHEYPAINSDGEIVQDASVIVPTTVEFSAIKDAIADCDGPTANQFRIGSERFHVSLALGKSCTALTALEQAVAPQHQE